MKKKSNIQKNTTERKSRKIPDIQIIDLEQNVNEELPDETDMDQNPDPEGPRFSWNKVMHLTLLAVVVIVLSISIYRIIHWGHFISQDEIFEDGEGTYSDTFDMFLPVLDADGNMILPNSDEELTILLLGNSPFSDDRDSADGLANMVAERTGANVINCSVSGSYMAAQWPYLSPEDVPWDAYTPYWLCALTCTDDFDGHYQKVAEILGDSAPPEADTVVETLSTIDMNTVDVMVLMYDATDYLLGHQMYSDDYYADIEQFTGNMEASIELIQNYFPHIRIIVMSPTYAFGVDENGEYISSDIKTYGQHFLSTYVIKQFASCLNRSVTFVDNLYGTITEDNAPEYLTDNVHLNIEGRKLVADRLIQALYYFSGENQGSQAE